MAKDGSHLSLGMLLTAALAASPGSGPLAAEVSFSGGFTDYSGPLGQTTFFSEVGPEPWVLGPPVTTPQGPTDFAGVGLGEVLFPEFSSGVAFSRLGTPSDPSSVANALVFTPAAARELNVGDEFTIGTFTFTNGGWFGDYPDSFFSFRVTTHSSDPDLDGHTYAGRLQLDITAGCGRPSTCGTSDPLEIAALNADYFFIEGHPEPNPQVVGVYDNDFLPGNGATNVGSVEFKVKIGSLIPLGFTNPTGGALIRTEVPEPPNLQIQPNPNPLLSTISVTDEKQNLEVFDNEGTISIASAGTLTNLATLQNFTSGLVSNSGHLVNEVGATVFNNGTIEIESGGVLDNLGNFNNSATLSNRAGARLTNKGTLTHFNGVLSNEGTLENRGTLENYARVENSGNFTNYASMTNLNEVENNGSFSNRSSFINSVGALVNNAFFFNDGDLFNEATITNHLNFGNQGLLQNSNAGVIDNRYTMVMYGGGATAGTLVNDAGGQVINSGMFSTFEVQEFASVNGAGSYTQTGFSAATIVNGTMSQGSIEIAAGTLSGTGMITATDGPLKILPGASVSPGNSTGTLYVGGDLLCDFCSMHIEIGGIEPGQFDVLEIAGAATLSGISLYLSFVDGFLPEAGNGFTFLTAAGGFTNFEDLNLSFNLNNLFNSLVIDGLAPDFLYGFEVTNGSLRLVARSDGHPVDPVPLPAPLWMLLSACGVIGACRRRLRSA